MQYFKVKEKFLRSKCCDNKYFFLSVRCCYAVMLLLSLCLMLLIPQNLYAVNAEMNPAISKGPNKLRKSIEISNEIVKDTRKKSNEEVKKEDIAEGIAEGIAENITEEHMDDVESSVFKKSSNVVYQFIGNNEYLTVPISGVAAGMIRCGIWCAVLGGVAGIIDELSVYFDLTKRRYLTWGILGLTTGHVINKHSLVPDVIGVVVGVLLPTGILNGHQELIAPTASMLAGNAIGGFLGAIVGTAGILDEILIDNGIEDKHYLTWGTAGAAAANTINALEFDINPAIADVIGVVLGLIVASYEKEISDNLLAPVKTTDFLYETYTKFIPKKELDNHIERHVLALIGNQFLTQFLSLKIMEYQQNLVYNFERLDNPANLAWGNFKTGMVSFAVFLFPYIIGQSFSGNIDNYFDKKLYVALEDQIKAELFSGEAILRLSHDKNNTVLMDNLRDDISTMANSGSGLITSAISTSVRGAYGIGIVMVHSPNIFVYSALYNKAENFVAEYLANQRRAYGESIRKLDSKLITTFKHDVGNIRTIVERDGMEAMWEKIQHISYDIRELEGERRLWGMINSLWWSISGTVDYVFNYFLVGREVNRGMIPFADRNKVQMANWQTSSLLSWSGHQAQTIAEIEQSLDRILILEGKLHFLPSNTNKIDSIKRELKEDKQLIFQDLEIGVGDRILVRIDNLELDMGKIYAVTGKTGCGKTSLLSKIKGIKENGIFGKGYIYYPIVNKNESMETKNKSPKIVMLSQQNYFPLDSSLYEIISYPDKAPDDSTLDSKKRKEISLLLQEIGLHAFDAEIDARSSIVDINAEVNNDECIEVRDKIEVCKKEKKDKKSKNNGDKKILSLESKNDWYTYLSGGEKKKIMAVSAIIKKPDILILDEIFNGLDPASIITVQRMLKKYLPNALILSVDHHARDNNREGFYNNELHFSNKSVILRKMEGRQLLD